MSDDADGRLETLATELDKWIGQRTLAGAIEMPELRQLRLVTSELAVLSGGQDPDDAETDWIATAIQRAIAKALGLNPNEADSAPKLPIRELEALRVLCRLYSLKATAEARRNEAIDILDKPAWESEMKIPIDRAWIPRVPSQPNHRQLRNRAEPGLRKILAHLLLVAEDRPAGEVLPPSLDVHTPPASPVDELRSWDGSAEPERRYDLLSFTWQFNWNEERDAWTGVEEAQRKVRCLTPLGIDLLEIGASRPSDRYLPFGPDNAPMLTVLRSERDRYSHRPGVVSVETVPTGLSSFERSVLFDPPVAEGETVEIDSIIVIPKWKYAFKEDLFRATSLDRSGAREYDFVSRWIGWPQRLVMKVFLPYDLGAVPRGLEVINRNKRRMPDEEEYVIDRDWFTQSTMTMDGVEGHLISLDVPDPRAACHYRLTWSLPSRPE